MGIYLMAAGLDLSWIINLLQVIIGLGMVIFVHELGHFLVAKACGVQCDKFYIGFDFGGLKLAKFQWGETEYGIGIFPLGGYVKMLGQEDNPARLREELERAKAGEQATEASSGDEPPADRGSASAKVSDQAEAVDRIAKGESDKPEPAEPKGRGSESTEPGSSGSSPAPTEAELAAAQQALYNPRSFLAQSVPKRMAIISAGVIMNLIFAFVVAIIAYGIGVKQVECGVGAIFPGEAAWRSDLQVGDRFLQIAGEPVHRFAELQQAISLGDIDDGVPMLVERPGRDEPFEVTVVPDRTRLAPTIGISGPYSLTLVSLDDEPPVMPGSAATEAKPPFQGGDRIVEVNGQPIEHYFQLHRYLATHRDEPLTFVVQRAVESREAATEDAVEQIEILVAPRPMERVGLQMTMGPIAAVQDGSPAQEIGLLRGDLIERVDGQPPGDPMTLGERLREQAQKSDHVMLIVRRPGREDPLHLKAPLRAVDWYEEPFYPGNPMSAPALGIAYHVVPKIQQISPGSPAAAEGTLGAGDQIVSATVVLPENEEPGVKMPEEDSEPLEFSEDAPNWPFFFYLLQQLPEGSTVELTTQSGSTAQLQPQPVDGWFNPDRGLLLEQEKFVRQADSLAEATTLGYAETVDALTMIYRTLQKLGTQISPKALGGPVEIFRAASRSASRGLAELLIFFTMLSANLAVLNFLPIPLLDGGHMVFLIYEGIRGKPADERIQLALTYLGLFFILALMVWVLGLDFGFISRH